jgi:hypothetical protein
LKEIGGSGVKTITYEEFLQFNPCYLENPKKKALMDSIAARRERWSALDILALDEIPAEDRLWAVLRGELIDAPILHEFACRCAERALHRVENPDPRSLQAIKVKRLWLKGEATDAELEAARDAAWYAAWYAARDAAWDVAQEAAWDAALDAALEAARVSAWHVRAAAWYAARDAALEAARVSARHVRAAAWDTERQWQVETLQKMLRAA